ncbi:hypothetical protein CRUP_005227 [Coryphaenoides rupestris]|nr:hypothetical protein CRUP_005227 [Coryphaenoides rupestris]
MAEGDGHLSNSPLSPRYPPPPHRITAHALSSGGVTARGVTVATRTQRSEASTGGSAMQTRVAAAAAAAAGCWRAGGGVSAELQTFLVASEAAWCSEGMEVL